MKKTNRITVLLTLLALVIISFLVGTLKSTGQTTANLRDDIENLVENYVSLAAKKDVDGVIKLLGTEFFGDSTYFSPQDKVEKLVNKYPQHPDDTNQTYWIYFKTIMFNHDKTEATAYFAVFSRWFELSDYLDLEYKSGKWKIVDVGRMDDSWTGKITIDNVFEY